MDHYLNEEFSSNEEDFNLNNFMDYKKPSGSKIKSDKGQYKVNLSQDITKKGI
jgi:hypothetical protein